MSPRLIQRNGIACLLALATATVFSVVLAQQAASVYVGPGPFGTLLVLDSAVQDVALRSRAPESYIGGSDVPDPRSLITLVGIDERTIAELGAYNGGYPRTYQAQLVDNLIAGAPRVIAFDMGFFEPTGADAAFAAALKRAHDHVPPIQVVLGASGLGAATVENGELAYESSLQPLPVLADQAVVAATNVFPDERGTIRSMPLLVRLEGVEHPTLGLAAMAAYLRRPAPYDTRPDGRSLQIAGRSIPTDQWARANINYFGPPSRAYADDSTFRVVSFVDVLRGRIDPGAWRNGIVFVGALGAAGLADDFWTPMSDRGRKMAGVEIHANVAATLFSTEFLRAAPLGVQIATTVLLALVVAGLAANLGAVKSVLAAISVLIGFTGCAIWLLHSRGIVLPLSFPILASVLPLFGVFAYRVATEQRHSRALQVALASVIPPSVAREIDRDPRRLRLGGERRTITVLFGDLKGFTVFSEATPPEVVSRVVTEYLDAMTTVVFRHGGTVDKFIGDAIMALWNAPLDDPAHARRACEAALDMQQTLARLSDEWEAQGLPRQSMRIGIHTGPASVGNMGTPRRFAYTAIGDTVNLAARLEPLNTTFGTAVCLSQATLDHAGAGRFATRYLDRVQVKGKREQVDVYALLGHADEGDLSIAA